MKGLIAQWIGNTFIRVGGFDVIAALCGGSGNGDVHP